MKVLANILILLLPVNLFAAIPKNNNAAIVAPFLKENLSFIGGQAGNGFSILDIRRSQDLKKQLERLVLDIGDLNGGPLKGKTGFYHVENRGQKIVISFSQMPKSFLNSDQLKNLAKGSLSIEKSYLIQEPDNSMMKLVLEFKNKPRIKIFDIKGQKTTAKLIVDLYK